MKMYNYFALVFICLMFSGCSVKNNKIRDITVIKSHSIDVKNMKKNVNGTMKWNDLCNENNKDIIDNDNITGEEFDEYIRSKYIINCQIANKIDQVDDKFSKAISFSELDVKSKKYLYELIKYEYGDDARVFFLDLKGGGIYCNITDDIKEKFAVYQSNNNIREDQNQSREKYIQDSIKVNEFDKFREALDEYKHNKSQEEFERQRKLREEKDKKR